MVPLTIVRIWPPGGASCNSWKFGHRVASLALAYCNYCVGIFMSQSRISKVMCIWKILHKLEFRSVHGSNRNKIAEDFIWSLSSLHIIVQLCSLLVYCTLSMLFFRWHVRMKLTLRRLATDDSAERSKLPDIRSSNLQTAQIWENLLQGIHQLFIKYPPLHTSKFIS